MSLVSETQCITLSVVVSQGADAPANFSRHSSIFSGRDKLKEGKQHLVYDSCANEWMETSRNAWIDWRKHERTVVSFFEQEMDKFGFLVAIFGHMY